MEKEKKEEKRNKAESKKRCEEVPSWALAKLRVAEKDVSALTSVVSDLIARVGTLEAQQRSLDSLCHSNIANYHIHPHTQMFSMADDEEDYDTSFFGPSSSSHDDPILNQDSPKEDEFDPPHWQDGAFLALDPEKVLHLLSDTDDSGNFKREEKVAKQIERDAKTEALCDQPSNDVVSERPVQRRVGPNMGGEADEPHNQLTNDVVMDRPVQRFVGHYEETDATCDQLTDNVVRDRPEQCDVGPYMGGEADASNDQHTSNVVTERPVQRDVGPYLGGEADASNDQHTSNVVNERPVQRDVGPHGGTDVTCDQLTEDVVPDRPVQRYGTPEGERGNAVSHQFQCSHVSSATSKAHTIPLLQNASVTCKKSAFATRGGRGCSLEQEGENDDDDDDDSQPESFDFGDGQDLSSIEKFVVGFMNALAEPDHVLIKYWCNKILVIYGISLDESAFKAFQVEIVKAFWPYRAGISFSKAEQILESVIAEYAIKESSSP